MRADMIRLPINVFTKTIASSAQTQAVLSKIASELQITLTRRAMKQSKMRGAVEQKFNTCGGNSKTSW